MIKIQNCITDGPALKSIMYNIFSYLENTSVPYSFNIFALENLQKASVTYSAVKLLFSGPTLHRNCNALFIRT